MLSAQQKYYIKNKERLLRESRERYMLNAEKERNRSKFYRDKNKEIIKIKRRLAMKSKRKSDPNFKIRSNISRLIRRALKNSGGKRGLSFLKYVDYNIVQLKNHLESLFEPWMNWNNLGVYTKKWNDNDQSTWTWQIDHIIPQSKLVYTSLLDINFKKCWSLSNLRPLNSKENFLKGNK